MVRLAGWQAREQRAPSNFVGVAVDVVDVAGVRGVRFTFRVVFFPPCLTWFLVLV